MKCDKCEKDIFKIKRIPSCDDCPENGAYDDETDEYIYDVKKIEWKELIRNQVFMDNECNFGTAFGTGCWMFTCECGDITNVSAVED